MSTDDRLQVAYLKANTSLTESLDANPRLATYVRSLELRKFYSKADDMQISTARIIQRLSQVNALCIVILGQLNPLLKVALTDIFKAPSVTRLSFEIFTIMDFGEMASLLSHVTHLKTLEVGNFACGHCTDHPLLDPIPTIPPRSIEIDHLLLRIEDHGPRYHSRLMKWFQRET
ncbi:hypothetical protein BT96DRAFT_44019 [Gymnopus androsaceus JB14]|uniref:F-box domain-containing protein n=1 Tax=Gymnopus androsaceus JB14 TaxID=1447944 RepID=A0A6A4HKH7_9AGAR|nr:hypothetical protein BT96DRAFT_44019 [Gymnopus androsaceus JB14]